MEKILIKDNKSNNEIVGDQPINLSLTIGKPLSSDKNTLKLTERIPIHQVKMLVSLEDDDYISLWWDPEELDEAGEKWDMAKYIKSSREWLQNILLYVRKEGLQDDKYVAMEKTYRRSGNKRLYVVGFGLQKCQNKLRKFLSGDYTYDVDISKCHWNIIVQLCNEYDIDCGRIVKFLHNPDKFMSDNNVDKIDLLTLLYQDNYTTYNDALAQLHKEKEYIFSRLIKTPALKALNFKPSPKAKVNKNTISSVCSQYLQHLECEIILPIIHKYINLIEVSMHDGFQISKEVDMKVLLADLNKTTDYTWIEKPNTYEVPGWQDVELTDYLTWAIGFERSHFVVCNPLQYCNIIKNETVTYKKTDFKDVNEPDLVNVNKWLQDEQRRSYNNFCMNPYQKGTIDPTPEDEYNLWKGFKGEIVELEDKYFPHEFYDLLYNSLCWHDDKAIRNKYTDWTIQYIGFLIQRPEVLPQVGIAFESDPGSGKDLFGLILEAVMGKHTMTITDNPNSVFNGMRGGDNFNKDAEGKKLIILNESVTSEMKELMDKIKHYVTSNEVIVNRKNKDTYTVKDVGALFIFTNNKFPLQQNDRRFVTHSAKSWTNISDDEKEAFFKPKWDLLYNETEINKLFTWLNQIDIPADWTPYNDRLQTVATQESKNFDIPDYVWYLKELCEDDFNRFGECDGMDSNIRIVTCMKDFWRDYRNWIQNYKNSDAVAKIINKYVLIKLKKVNGVTIDKFRYTVSGSSRQVRGVKFNIQEVKDWINSKYSFQSL